MTARLVLEYDGSRFAGWARQPASRTVQAEVERALCVLLRAESMPVTVAGRTDAGVHAWGQVASYSGPAAPIRGLNAVLPEDVAAVSCDEAADDFDARRDASSRAYCYRILARPARSALSCGRVLHWPHAVDFSALCACAEALGGVHDFTAFTPTETEHVRFQRQVLAVEWRRGDAGWEAPAGGSAFARGAPAGGSAFARGAPAGGSALARGAPAGASAFARGAPAGGSAFARGAPAGALLEFWIEADAFMRNMIRVLVGTMLEVGGGRRSVEEFVALLSGRPRAEAGPTAPPHGLYLAGAGYEGRRVLTL